MAGQFTMSVSELKKSGRSGAPIASLPSPTPLVQIVDLKERKWPSTVDPDTLDTQNLQRQTLDHINWIFKPVASCTLTRRKELLSILDLRITLNAEHLGMTMTHPRVGPTFLASLASLHSKVTDFEACDTWHGENNVIVIVFSM